VSGKCLASVSIRYVSDTDTAPTLKCPCFIDLKHDHANIFLLLLKLLLLTLVQNEGEDGERMSVSWWRLG